MDLYERVKLIRYKHGLKVSDIAAELKLSRSYIHKLLQGVRGSAMQRQRIADYVYEKEKETGEQSLRAQIKTRCVEKGITVKELARQMEVSLSFLYKVLNRESKNKVLEEKLRRFVI